MLFAGHACAHSHKFFKFPAAAVHMGLDERLHVHSTVGKVVLQSVSRNFDYKSSLHFALLLFAVMLSAEGMRNARVYAL